MQREFLNALVGLSVNDASKAATRKGHEVNVYKEGTILPAIAMPNTVKLYYKPENPDIVSGAYAGDPCEVTENQLVS